MKMALYNSRISKNVWYVIHISTLIHSFYLLFSLLFFIYIVVSHFSNSPKRSATRINHLEGQTSGHFYSEHKSGHFIYSEHKSGHFYSEHKSGHGTHGRTFTNKKKFSLPKIFYLWVILNETILKTFYQSNHIIYQKMSKIGGRVFEKNAIIQHTDFIYYY